MIGLYSKFPRLQNREVTKNVITFLEVAQSLRTHLYSIHFDLLVIFVYKVYLLSQSLRLLEPVTDRVLVNLVYCPGVLFI